LDLESALGKAEDSLLFNVFHLKDKDNEEAKARRRNRSLSNLEDGFLYALKKIDEQHGLRTSSELSQLSKYTAPIELKAGETLDRDRTTRGAGIYFVETGHLRIEHDSTFSTLSTSSSPFTSDQDNSPDSLLSLGHLNARTSALGRQIAKWKEKHGKGVDISEQSFRLAQVGQGWIIGGIEAANGMRRQGIYAAITASRLHFLSMDMIHQLEANDPSVAMRLYKVLSLLSTKRQEATIRQLGQFVRIMKSPTPRLRGGKSELVRLQHV
jgi:CRP-like cAMP-binding protein